MFSEIKESQKEEVLFLLKKVAQKQKQILLYHFDWNKKELIRQTYKKKFFNRKSRIDKNYELLIQELEQFKDRLRKIYKIENDKNELLWWNIPWESVEPYLLYNLREEKAIGKWRYEYNWEAIGDKEIKILILKEKGHFSDFSSNTYKYKENESEYNEFEQKQMVDEMNEKLDKKEKKEIFWNNNKLVESERGNIYASLEDYYDSSEHKFNRQINSDMYARSLYTEHTTQVSTIISNSKHYACIFEIGSFYFDNKEGLQGLSWHPFELKAAEGDIPNNLSEKYKNKDSAVVCAAFICDQYWIQSVLIKLFGQDFTDKANSIAESYQRSQIFTCLSNKLM